MIRGLLLTFIPLFVAVDIVAVVLVYLGIGVRDTVQVEVVFALGRSARS